MRDFLYICLQAITGNQGRFSDEMEAFWREVEKQYNHCNVRQIPQDHIPIWWARAMDQGIPIAPVEKTAKVESAPKREKVGAGA